MWRPRLRPGAVGSNGTDLWTGHLGAGWAAARAGQQPHRVTEHRLGRSGALVTVKTTWGEGAMHPGISICCGWKAEKIVGQPMLTGWGHGADCWTAVWTLAWDSLCPRPAPGRAVPTTGDTVSCSSALLSPEQVPQWSTTVTSEPSTGQKHVKQVHISWGHAEFPLDPGTGLTGCECCTTSSAELSPACSGAAQQVGADSTPHDTCFYLQITRQFLMSDVPWQYTCSNVRTYRTKIIKFLKDPLQTLLILALQFYFTS